LSLIQSEAKNAFEVAMEEEKSDTEQPRTTTSWGRPSRDSLPKEVHYDEIGPNILRREDGRRRRCRILQNITDNAILHQYGLDNLARPSAKWHVGVAWQESVRSVGCGIVFGPVYESRMQDPAARSANGGGKTAKWRVAWLVETAHNQYPHWPDVPRDRL
ncbi:hypothetical protein ILUMI_00221, partial [Ignelater luminosus]